MWGPAGGDGRNERALRGAGCDRGWDRGQTRGPATFLRRTDARGVLKTDFPHNAALPRIQVDPDTFAVHIDDEFVEEAPVDELPLAGGTGCSDGSGAVSGSGPGEGASTG